MNRAFEFEATCPHCGCVNELHTDPVDGGRPKPGDISICWSCVGVAQYTAGLGLQLIPEEEYDKVLSDENFQKMLTVVRHAKAGRTAQQN